MGPKTMAEKLHKLRGYCEMDKAEFSNGYRFEDDPLPAKESDATAFIVNRTRLYRETWILPIIDELIEATERTPRHRNLGTPATVEASAAI